jgi:hypothetical protein
VNIDDTTTGERPAHTLLLAAGIPVVEHLTGLKDLPPTGARFTAVPPAVRGLATFASLRKCASDGLRPLARELTVYRSPIPTTPLARHGAPTSDLYRRAS